VNYDVNHVVRYLIAVMVNDYTPRMYAMIALAKSNTYKITSPPIIVTVSPSPTPYKRKTNVTIAGSGFEPNQEIGIRIMMGGVLSDISFLIKPRPVPNEFGAFASTWKLNREIRRKLLKAATAYTLSVVDAEGNTIAHAPMVMDKAKKKKKKKK